MVSTASRSPIPREGDSTAMTSISEPQQYQAVVFEQASPTSDFSCSREIVLPGQHTAAGAWKVMVAALHDRSRGALIGGEVRPFCGKGGGKGCGNPLPN
jgi:hypothetical protein